MTGVHIYIDETGQLAGERTDSFLAVGGVAIIGPHDCVSDGALLRALREALVRAGGRFPYDLHTCDARASHVNSQKVTVQLNHELKAWRGTERAICGVAIKHAEDIHSASSVDVREQERDNRYLLMLKRLIEYVIFLDPHNDKRADEPMRVSVTVANRAFTVRANNGVEERYKRLGYNIQRDRRDQANLVVTSTIRAQDLREMLVSLADSWASLSRSFQIDEVRVERIVYDSASSPAGLYLADMYLGMLRASTPSFAVQREIALTYGERYEWLRSIARAYAGRAYAEVVELAVTRTRADDDEVQRAVQRFLSSAWMALASNGREVNELAERAVALVNEPGKLDQAEKLVEGLLSMGDTDTVPALRPYWRIPFNLLQARLSLANHRGAIGLADRIWCEALQAVDGLKGHGVEGFTLECELRNRRAVTLVDRFEYDEAERTIRGVIERREEVLRHINPSAVTFLSGVDVLRKQIAEGSGEVAPQVQQICDYSLGACLGTLGQIIALQGTNRRDEARECFQKACKLFDNPSDQQRQLVYLGHLACESGDAGGGLWNEVTNKLPALIGTALIGSDGNQYMLALQLKGLVVFGSFQRLRAALDELPACLASYSDESLAHHPFGLIHQVAALGWIRLMKMPRDNEPAYCIRKANEAFGKAAEHMYRGGPLLRLLAAACDLRAALFNEQNRSAKAPDALSRALENFITLASAEPFTACYRVIDGRCEGAFGRRDPGPTRPAARAAELLKGITFNYW